MTRDTLIPDTREDILLEIQTITDELEAHVMDADSADDRTPDVLRMVRRVEHLEQRLRTFNTYGVHSMDQLRAEPRYVRDHLLHRAVHSVEQAGARWQRRREVGLTDVELIAAFDLEAGKGLAGASIPAGWYQCRPGLFTYCDPQGQHRELKGSALAGHLRRILRIPVQPGVENVAVEQLILF